MNQQGAFIITGATGGLGTALAEEACKEGHPIALIARSKAKLERLRRDLNTKHSHAALISIHALDLTNEKKTHREFDAIIAKHRNIRALINNAATWMGTTTIEQIRTSDILKSLELNFFTAFHATKATLAARGERDRSPLAIINVGATASTDSWIEVLPFCTAKAALRGMSRALGRELGPRGVHVAHVIIDGVLDNERTKKLNPTMPLNRFISTHSVAQSIMQVALQNQSCWTSEWDIRPFNENW